MTNSNGLETPIVRWRIALVKEHRRYGQQGLLRHFLLLGEIQVVISLDFDEYYHVVIFGVTKHLVVFIEDSENHTDVLYFRFFLVQCIFEVKMREIEADAQLAGFSGLDELVFEVLDFAYNVAWLNHGSDQMVSPLLCKMGPPALIGFIFDVPFEGHFEIVVSRVDCFQDISFSKDFSTFWVEILSSVPKILIHLVRCF